MSEGQIRERLVRGTAASPRLDALGSLGFGISRTRMAREIKAERVRLNGVVITDAARTVNVGDVMTLEGRGDAVLEDVSGPTRKGRLGVTLKRILTGQASL